MYFSIQKEWEAKSPLGLLSGGPEERSFPLVEISLNLNIFLVDAEVGVEDDCSVVSRFMFGDVVETLQFIDQDIFKNSSISLLSRRCDNDGEYSVSDLIETIEAKDDAGQMSHIYCCKDGKKYIDSSLASSEQELTDLKTIYYKTLKGTST